MKRTRHSEAQIIAILKQGEAGLTTAELCRQRGMMRDCLTTPVTFNHHMVETTICEHFEKALAA